MNNLPKLLSISDAAEQLCVSKSTVERMLRRGELPYLQMGRRRRIDVRDLQRWIDEKKAETSGAPAVLDLSMIGLRRHRAS